MLFFLIFHFYIQAKNQKNRMKRAKIFGSPVSVYNVGHVGCRKKEPFGSDNWEVEHHCCQTYGISNIEQNFDRQFNSQTNVGQIGCQANGKSGN